MSDFTIALFAVTAALAPLLQVAVLFVLLYFAYRKGSTK